MATDQRLRDRLAQSFELHQIAEREEMDVSIDVFASDALQAALPVLQHQAGQRIWRDFDRLANGRGHGRRVLSDEANLTLLLAIFICARQQGGDLQLTADRYVMGDHLRDLNQLKIEVGAQRGDFDIEFLFTRTETGPHPDWSPDDPSSPHSLTVVCELALVRDEVYGGSPIDDKIRRKGLSSLGVTMMPYQLDEAAREPFGLAKRVLAELSRLVRDQRLK